MTSVSNRIVLSGLAVALVLLSLVSLDIGKVSIPWSVWMSPDADARWTIIFELRVPRTIIGIITGMALGMSGAALQGYTRNPLADPAVLGISTLASLGAVLTLYLGMAASSLWILSSGAMIGALIGVVLLLTLAGASSTMLTFILAGVILNLVAGAGVALALNLAPNPWAISEIINWLMGSLADRSMAEARFATPFVLAGCALLMMARRALDALTLGEIGARSLGIPLPAVRIMLAVGVGLATGASVAVAGVIGFVGLVTPHLLRPVVGARPGGLLLPSALAGAVVVLTGDIAVRLLPSAVEVKLGVAMAAVGGPFFLMLLLSERRRLA